VQGDEAWFFPGRPPLLDIEKLVQEIKSLTLEQT
jgi:hypothetical protein